MRKLFKALIGITAAFTSAAMAADKPLNEMPYPGVIALSETSPGKWTYRSFPTLLALYVFNGERPGLSTCDKQCIQVWPIIRAEPNDKPTGDWSIVKRDDGLLQWAYKNKPVYTYFEDQPNEAKGVGKPMDWYLGEGGIQYLTKAGVTVLAPTSQTGGKKIDEKKTAALLNP